MFSFVKRIPCELSTDYFDTFFSQRLAHDLTNPNLFTTASSLVMYYLYHITQIADVHFTR